MRRLDLGQLDQTMRPSTVTITDDDTNFSFITSPDTGACLGRTWSSKETVYELKRYNGRYIWGRYMFRSIHLPIAITPVISLAL